jgi:hypothetical protein
MEVVYELRARFGDECEDIVASEHDDDRLQLEQGGEVLVIPKAHAAVFMERLATWVSTGGRVA